ncbi:hypothetical protein P691DRAFT_458876 [Macrolepiota fuliginosa MF-IS2]|uniref:Uncharacterized protein n=1 Tax=Macrolepiota fuliginosa MF-IS2 TaxID=1400762 RepID=A0A9P5XGK8_9AGAR|nr:hypothetical protein P691DRAFT_458876 [Macrolepiota fuliginosa MF-IS2]
MLSRQPFASVLSHILGFKAFRRFSKASKETFTYEISLIALSIRTGYLVDVLHIPEHLAEQTYTLLLKELGTISECFRNVLHLHEPCTNQSFFIHKNKLLQKLEASLSPRSAGPYPVFIHLPEKGEPCVLDSIPLPVLEVFQFNLGPGSTSSSSTLRLPQDLPSTTSIPLAAFVLDYPVAYVPASASQTSFLSGVPLVIYRCYIQPRTPPPGDDNGRGRQHTLLQFSCPGSFADDPTGLMSLSRTISHLENTFQPLIAQSLPGCIFHVTCERVILDRVAL